MCFTQSCLFRATLIVVLLLGTLCSVHCMSASSTHSHSSGTKGKHSASSSALNVSDSNSLANYSKGKHNGNDAGNNSCTVLCSGELFEMVQLYNIFNNSKYFVDMKLLNDSEVVLKEFKQLKRKNKGNIKPKVLESFILKYFDVPGNDLVALKPLDWKRIPRFIDAVDDKSLRDWLLELNKLWKEFARKTPEDVKNNPLRYSQIYLPHGFIVPGGMFREMYFWDTYWIVDGLLLCGMKETVKGILENFLYLVDTIGYVPNASRKYYIGRSQVPLLLPMVDLYVKAIGNYSFVEKHFPLLEKEYDYWNNYSRVNFTHENVNYALFTYRDNATGPRPEGYYDDYNILQNMTKARAGQFSADIRAACASGWDFSSRWFINENGRSDNFMDLKTHDVVPVDLNSIMGYNAHLLSVYSRKLGMYTKEARYASEASMMNHTISRLFWNDQKGFWFDFSLRKRGLVDDTFYGSGFVPLFTRSYGKERDPKYIVDKVLQYMKDVNLTKFPGGMPASLYNSSQQWDYPLGWAPLQYFAVMGLRDAATFNKSAEVLAHKLASKWVLNTYYTYINNTPHRMMEKYNVTTIGVAGNGGFYPNQSGFGWTNAVVMRFLALYPESIRTTRRRHEAAVIVGVALIVVIVATLGNFIYMQATAFHKKKGEQKKLKGDGSTACLMSDSDGEDEDDDVNYRRDPE